MSEAHKEWHLDQWVKTPFGDIAAGSAGAGPPLILAHGWPWSSFSWHAIIPALANHFQVHWYDMPGYGRSQKNVDLPTSLDVQGQVFAHMVRHWRLECPNVIAHDLGGATTLRAHFLHDVEFERYIAINIVAIRPWGSDFFDHVGKHVDAFTGIPVHIHEGIVRAYILGALPNGLAFDGLEALIAPWLTEEGQQSFYSQFAQADERHTAEIEHMYGTMRCPTKIIWGEDDPWIPLARGRKLGAAMAGSSFEVIPKAGHIPQLEAADILLPKLLDFLHS